MKATRVITAIAAVGALAAPAVAQAMTPAHEAQHITKALRRELDARVRVLAATYPGMRVVTLTVRCGGSGGGTGGTFFCTGTYVLHYKNITAKYLVGIDGYSNGAWKTNGPATQVSERFTKPGSNG